MGLVGNLTPGSTEHPFGTRENPNHDRWEAPWYPDEKYFDYDHRRQRCRVRYDRMIADYTSATRLFYQAANRLAAGNGWEPPKMGQSIHPRFTDVLGQLPQSPKIPEAAQAGDRWLLGFSQEPNDLLQKLLRETGYSDWTGMSYEDALAVANGPREPLSSPDGVLAMTDAQLQAMIAQAVANALASQAVPPVPTKKKGPSPEHMAKMQQAATAKRLAQAGASAPV
jgi:hypothetical protein